MQVYHLANYDQFADGRMTARSSAMKKRKAPAEAAESVPSINWKKRVVRSVLVALLAIAAALAYAKFVIGAPSHLRPLDAPPALDFEDLNDPAYKKEMLWGTYRPQVYFGARARVPESLLMGLMWSSTQRPFDLRHTCEQGDNLQQYGWERHDGRSFAEQTIVDGRLRLHTSFIKDSETGDWTAHIVGDADKSVTANLFLYAGLESPADHFDVTSNDADGSGSVAGSMASLNGDYRMSFSVEDTACHVSSHTHVVDGHHHFHNLTQYVRQQLHFPAPGGPIRMHPTRATKGTLSIRHLVLSTPFAIHIRYDSGERAAAAPPAAADTSARLDELRGAFDARFERTFGLASRGVNETVQAAARAALSNLVGSMGYFYGSSLIRDPLDASRVNAYWPAPLFSSVPSRSFFPRGFLWDEGFHQLLTVRWDPLLSMDALAHWLDLMNADGWIPREQILGAEARSKVPSEFVVQGTDIANPPTLLLPLGVLLRTAQSGGDQQQSDRARRFLAHVFPRIEAWVAWYERTQTGPRPHSYRWRGRVEDSDRELNPKTLASGLDDFPRASHPSSDERHVDLYCWMAMASAFLRDAAAFVGGQAAEVAASAYGERAAALFDDATLDAHHWDARRAVFADFGNHTEDVALVARGGPAGAPLTRILRGRPPRLRYVPQLGYVSLFPLIARIVDPASPRVEQLVDAVERLASPFGLRSLSTDSSLYRKSNTRDDPPYWRNAVWINVNYLVAASLKHYADELGHESPVGARAAAAYEQVRESVVGGIMRQHAERHYFFEQYDDETGLGKGCFPFNGWTSLVVLLMSEKY